MTGTVGGYGLSVGAVVYCPSGFAANDDLTVLLTQRADSCAVFQADKEAANNRTLSIHLVQVSGPATFPVVQTAGPGQALATFYVTGVSCNYAYVEPATGGTVTVTSVSTGANGSIRGSFQIAFASGQLSGQFDSSVCRTAYYCGSGSGGCAP